jgi:hypothetical protein
MDSEGSLLVVDWDQFRVMRSRRGVGDIVADGNSRGMNLTQPDNPIGLFLDSNRVVYVADRSNHSVAKWELEAKEGTSVGGGNDAGSNLNQLNGLTGTFVDMMGTV